MLLVAGLLALLGGLLLFALHALQRAEREAAQSVRLANSAPHGTARSRRQQKNSGGSIAANDGRAASGGAGAHDWLDRAHVTSVSSTEEARRGGREAGEVRQRRKAAHAEVAASGKDKGRDDKGRDARKEKEAEVVPRGVSDHGDGSSCRANGPQPGRKVQRAAGEPTRSKAGMKADSAPTKVEPGASKSELWASHEKDASSKDGKSEAEGKCAAGGEAAGERLVLDTQTEPMNSSTAAATAVPCAVSPNATSSTAPAAKGTADCSEATATRHSAPSSSCSHDTMPAEASTGLRCPSHVASPGSSAALNTAFKFEAASSAPAAGYAAAGAESQRSIPATPLAPAPLARATVRVSYIPTRDGHEGCAEAAADPWAVSDGSLGLVSPLQPSGPGSAAAAAVAAIAAFADAKGLAGSRKGGREPQPRVWVAPLMASALEHENELKASFAHWGTVIGCKVKVDGARVSPGYGFIYFREASSAHALLKHISGGGDAPVFMGKSLHIREAFFKEEQAVDPAAAFASAPPSDISSSTSISKLHATASIAPLSAMTNLAYVASPSTDPSPRVDPHARRDPLRRVDPSAYAPSSALGFSSPASCGKYLQAVCSTAVAGSAAGTPSAADADVSCIGAAAVTCCGGGRGTGRDFCSRAPLPLPGRAALPTHFPDRLPGFLPPDPNPPIDLGQPAADSLQGMPPSAPWLQSWLSSSTGEPHSPTVGSTRSDLADAPVGAALASGTLRRTVGAAVGDAAVAASIGASTSLGDASCSPSLFGVGCNSGSSCGANWLFSVCAVR